ncbi:MAG: 3-oxo-5-alpha-steroid 4-dehydrogenase, partial [Anaerolineae bacterium]
MNEQALFNLLLFALFCLAMVTAIALVFVTAPYGRHIRKGWGPTLDNRLGWIIMEAPAPLVFALCFLVGEYRGSLTAWVFLLMWEVHYLHRAFIYPLGLRDSGKRMPIIVAGIGFLFNALNGYLNGRYLYSFSGGYPNGWLADPRFIAGVILFATGYAINR